MACTPLTGRRTEFKSRLLLQGVAACLILLLNTQTWGRSHNKQTPPTPSDPGYVLALAAANRFLHAWQMGDLADGMVLLSDGVRHSHDPDKLEQFFEAETDRAFEIGAGHGNRGRYSFPVVLVTLKGTDAGSTTSPNLSLSRRSVSRRSSTIVLVSAGKNDWVVDKLP